MVDLYRVFSILAGIPTQVLSKDMTAVDLSDSDKKNLQILYCNVFMENYITGIQL